MPGKTEKSAEEFWLEYEEKIGQKVLARSLGQYLSGWEDFDIKGLSPAWGLLIATSGGFRFHHFPQRNWLQAMRGQDGSKENIIYIPKEKLISASFIIESRWWVNLLKAPLPKLMVIYRDQNDNEQTMLLEANLKAGKNNKSELLAEKLNSIINEETITNQD